ncbi:MAG: antibiotic biosynthesis monooxygenase [Actinomycetota bacterium]
MAVLVQFRVKVPDTERFKKTVENLGPEMRKEPGFASFPGVYTAESDRSEVTDLEVWESHDHMHAASEKHGEQFNADAGTEGLDWETRIWKPLAGEQVQPVDESRVLVQFRVRVPDVEKFRSAWEELAPLAQQDGARNNALYQSESDPNELAMFAEWASHDEMHASSEKRGEEFQSKAGTEGLDWETRIWHRLV